MRTHQNLINSLKRDGVIVSLTPNHRLFVEGNLNDALREKIRVSKNNLIFHLLQEKVMDLNLPAAFELTLTTILTRAKPTSLSQVKWDFVLMQARLWIEEGKSQLENIIKNGWTLQDIFGCHQTSPGNRYECMGMLLLLQVKTIETVNQDCILFKTASGATQSYWRPQLISPAQTTLDFLP